MRYHSFGSFIKRRFGTSVHKVNVDAGFTCPNRDGTLGVSGCIYCNNDSFRPSSCKSVLPIKEQVRNGIVYLRRRYGTEKFIVYFQAYTNTYGKVEDLESLYREALADQAVVGLAIGTRPDCIDAEKIDLLESLARRHFILVEYGVQSIYDKSLKFISRGHDYQTFLNALHATKDRGIGIGVHIIVGFPTETKEEMLSMADEISALPVHFLKIHQLQIVNHTPLASLFAEEPFPVFCYDEYIDFIVDFIERLPTDIVLQRLFATAPDTILIAPKWERSRHAILRDIEQRFLQRDTYQGKKCTVAIRDSRI